MNDLLKQNTRFHIKSTLIFIFFQQLDQVLEEERLEIEKVQKEVDMLDSDNEDLTEEQLDALEAQVRIADAYTRQD